MNRNVILIAAMAMMSPLILPAQSTQPQPPVLWEGVGPVIAGSVDLSQLPKEAREFLKKLFKDKTVTKCELEFTDRSYDIDLADGTDIEFDSKGQWTEVDAGNRRVLPMDLVRHLIPDMARKEIERRELAGRIETIKRSTRGYKVEFRGTDIDDIRFDSHGRVLKINLDD